MSKPGRWGMNTIRTLGLLIFCGFLTSCGNTIILKYDELPETNASANVAPNSQAHLKNFLKHGKSDHGYAKVTMRFLYPNSLELPQELRTEEGKYIAASDICGDTSFDWKQDEISGFVMGYVGDNLSIDQISNPTILRENGRIGHYFIVRDPESKDKLKCFIERQDYVVVLETKWNRVKPLKMTLVTVNQHDVESNIGEGIKAVTSLTKVLDPTDVVFKASELANVDKLADRLDVLINNYLSKLNSTPTPITFLFEGDSEKYKARKFIRFSYKVIDAQSKKVVREEQTVGYVELAFVAVPTLFDATYYNEKGYPDFNKLDYTDLPSDQFVIDGQPASIQQTIAIAQPNGNTVEAFNTACKDLEGVLGRHFGLSDIDMAGALSLFSERVRPGIFSNRAAVPSLDTLPPLPQLNALSGYAEKIEKLDALKQATNEWKNGVYETLRFYKATCWRGYLDLIAELKLPINDNLVALENAIKAADQRIAKLTPELIPQLPSESRTNYLATRFNDTILKAPTTRIDDNFKDWVSGTGEIVLESPATDTSPGQTVTSTFANIGDFREATNGLQGYLSCYVNISNLVEGSNVQTKAHLMGYADYHFAAIYTDYNTNYGANGHMLLLGQWQPDPNPNRGHYLLNKLMLVKVQKEPFLKLASFHKPIGTEKEGCSRKGGTLEAVEKVLELPPLPRVNEARLSLPPESGQFTNVAVKTD